MKTYRKKNELKSMSIYKKQFFYIVFMLFFTQSDIFFSHKFIDYVTAPVEATAHWLGFSKSKKKPTYNTRYVNNKIGHTLSPAEIEESNHKIEYLSLEFPKDTIQNIDHCLEAIQDLKNAKEQEKALKEAAVISRLEKVVKSFKKNKQQFITIHEQKDSNVQDAQKRIKSLWEKIPVLEKFVNNMNDSHTERQKLKKDTQKTIANLKIQEEKIIGLENLYKNYLQDFNLLGQMWKKIQEEKFNIHDTNKSMSTIENTDMLGSLLLRNKIYYFNENASHQQEGQPTNSTNIKNSQIFSFFVKTLSGSRSSELQYKVFESLYDLSMKNSELALQILIQGLLSIINNSKRGYKDSQNTLKAFQTFYATKDHKGEKSNNIVTNHMGSVLDKMKVTKSGINCGKMEFLGVEHQYQYKKVSGQDKLDQQSINSIINQVLENDKSNKDKTTHTETVDKKRKNIGKSYRENIGLNYRGGKEGLIDNIGNKLNLNDINAITNKDLQYLQLLMLEDNSVDHHTKIVINYLITRGRTDPQRALKEIINDYKNLIDKHPNNDPLIQEATDDNDVEERDYLNENEDYKNKNKEAQVESKKKDKSKNSAAPASKNEKDHTYSNNQEDVSPAKTQPTQTKTPVQYKSQTKKQNRSF